MTVLIFLPPLRHFVTPLLKKRFFVWLPLRGAVDAVDCGVAFLCFMLLPPLRHFVTPLLKESFFVWLPLRRAVDIVDCGVAFLCFMLLPPLRHFVTPLLKERLFVWLSLRGVVDTVECGVVIYLFHFSDNISIWSANFAKSLLAIPSQLLATASNLSAAAISLPNTVAARFVVFFFCTRMPYVCTTTSPVSKS